jgi:plastocyanin domain-containing protein
MKATIISILVAVVMIGGVLMLTAGNKDAARAGVQNENNVTIVDGKQVITIRAKGDYSPNITIAKADIPTVIKMATQATFDCTAALTIPTLGITKNLPPTGETEIEVPPQKAGTTVRGLCAMGMKNFSINFN